MAVRTVKDPKSSDFSCARQDRAEPSNEPDAIESLLGEFDLDELCELENTEYRRLLSIGC